MACGVFPVVVDNASNRVWVKHGKNGFLYPAGDLAELPRLLAAAIADPKLRAKAAAFNIDQVRERADWKVNMSVMEKRHIELCGEAALRAKSVINVQVGK
jgi:glycosyltransferase involved in cell wall biosynthesis